VGGSVDPSFPTTGAVFSVIPLENATGNFTNGAMGRMLQNMTARWGEALGGPVAGHAAALSRLWHLAYREPSTLAYADAFRAIMMPSWSQRCWSRCCAKWGRPKPRPPKRIDPNGRDWRNVVGRLI
jgi:hypothetical protein